MNNKQKQEFVMKTIQAFNNRDLDLYFSFHTDNATSWEVYFPEPIRVKQSSDFILAYWRAFPDARVEPQNVWAIGTSVFVENVVSGTFQNEFLGQKPTGKYFKQREAAIFEFQKDKIAAVRIYCDRKEQEEQLGTA